MERYVVDIILITLAVVILLHLIYNNSMLSSVCHQGNKNEHMENNGSQEGIQYSEGKYRDPNTFGIDRTDPSLGWYHVVNKMVDDNTTKGRYCGTQCKKDGDYHLVFGDNYEEGTTSDPYDASPIKKPINIDYTNFRAPSENMTDMNDNACAFNESDKNIKRYIRDYVLDGNTQCECAINKSQSSFTRNEIDNYREKQLEFRDKIYGTSSPSVDAVDRMNIVTMKNGIGASGGTISEFYDNVVGQRVSNLNGPGFIHGSTIPTKGCVRTPQLDTSVAIPHSFYTDSGSGGGKYMMQDNWIYDNENPNNGGIMFDDIKGTDPMMEFNRMVI